MTLREPFAPAAQQVRKAEHHHVLKHPLLVLKPLLVLMHDYRGQLALEPQRRV